MALEVQGNFEYDEQLVKDEDDDDVVALSSDMQAVLTSLGSLPYASFSGFPQYAEKDDLGFITYAGITKDLFLTGVPTGDPPVATPFSTTEGIETELKVGDESVYLFALAGKDNVVVGRIGSGGAADDGGDIAFVLMLKETKDADGFVIDADLGIAVYAPLTHDGVDLIDDADIFDLDGLLYLGATEVTSTPVPFANFASVKSGQNAFAPVASTDADAPDVELLITGFSGNTAGTVNVSTTGLGVNAQHIDPTESLRIDVVAGLDTSGALDAKFVHEAGNINYDNHVDVYQATFAISQLNPTNKPATLTLRAYQDDDSDGAGPDDDDYQGTAFPGKAISDAGSVVTIAKADVIILNAADVDITDTFGGTIDQVGDGVKISGLLTGYQVRFTTGNDFFDRFTITNSYTGSGPSTFDVGAIEVSTLQGGSTTTFAELGSHVQFEDDGPNIDSLTSSASVNVSEATQLGNAQSASFATLFGTPDYGADGEASSNSLTFSVGTLAVPTFSGLIDTATGRQIFLFAESGNVVGRVGTSSNAADANGTIDFTISVDQSGNVSFKQDYAVYHDKTTNDTSVGFASTINLLTLTATVTDSDGDTDEATVDITGSFAISDDTPALTEIAPTQSDPTPNDLVVDNKLGASDNSYFTVATGADGLGSLVFTGVPDTSGDFTFARYDVNKDTILGDNEIRGYYKNAPLYDLIINPDGTYTFTMVGELASSDKALDVTNIKAGGPDTGAIEVGLLDGSGDYVVLDGEPGNINESNAFVGVGNGNLDKGESIEFSMHDGSTDAVIPILGLVIGTKSAKASSYTVEIDFVDPSKANLVYVQPVAKNTALTIDPAGNDLIESITITKESGSALKLGLGDIKILVPAEDVTLSFEVKLNDGDQDSATQSFSVSIDGDHSGTIDDPISALSVNQIFDHSLMIMSNPAMLEDLSVNALVV